MKRLFAVGGLVRTSSFVEVCVNAIELIRSPADVQCLTFSSDEAVSMLLDWLGFICGWLQTPGQRYVFTLTPNASTECIMGYLSGDGFYLFTTPPPHVP